MPRDEMISTGPDGELRYHLVTLPDGRRNVVAGQEVTTHTGARYRFDHGRRQGRAMVLVVVDTHGQTALVTPGDVRTVHRQCRIEQTPIP